VNHEIGNESQQKGKQMGIGFVILLIVLGLFGWLWWWGHKLDGNDPSSRKSSSLQRIEAAKMMVGNKSETDSPTSTLEATEQKFEVNPIPKGNTKMNDDNGIADLIRQQEQTNRYFQKLISDFFWFRVAIIGFLIFGSIGVVFK